jgi:hypothetical protein
VSEAARVLGITEAAVRERINRGKLETEKVGNIVYVRLDSDATRVSAGDQTVLVEALRDQVSMLKQQLNTEQVASGELRRIIAALKRRRLRRVLGATGCIAGQPKGRTLSDAFFFGVVFFDGFYGDFTGVVADQPR